MRITSITNDLIKMGKENTTDVPRTLYYAGEIINMILVFDPISADLQKLMSSDFRMPDVNINLPQVTLDDALEYHAQYQRDMSAARPIVRDNHAISEPGAFEGLTGKQMLGTMDGIVDLVTGFLRGTGLVTDT